MSGFLDPRVSPANLDALTAGKITNPGTATATALNATYALKADAAKALDRKTFDLGIATNVGLPVHGVAIGSSTIQGVGASGSSSRFLNRLEKMFQASYNPRGIAGGYSVRAYDADMWTTTGTVTEVREGLGLRSMSLASGATATHTTPGTSTGIEIYFAQGPGCTPFTVTIDAESPITVTPATTTAIHNGVWKSRVLTRGVHTYKITSTGKTVFNTAYVFDQDNHVGFRLHNSGRGAVGIFDWQYNSDTLYQRIAQLRPIVIPIMTGSNEWAGQGGTSPAQYKTWFNAVLDKIKAVYGSGPLPWVPLLGMHRIDPDSQPISFTAYLDVMQELADENPSFVTFHSLYDDFPHSQATDPYDLIGPDSTHLTDKGHTVAALKLAEKFGLPSRSLAFVEPPAAQIPFVESTVITDTFTRADSATVGTTETGSKTWTVDATSGGISGNRAFVTGGSNLLVLDTGLTDYNIAGTVTSTAAPTNQGLVFLYSAVNERFVYYYEASTGNMRMGKYHPVDTSGNIAFLGASVPKTIAIDETHEFRVRVVGNVLTCSVDGVVTHTYTLTSSEVAQYKTKTKAGFRLGGTTTLADDFAVKTVEV